MRKKHTTDINRGLKMIAKYKSFFIRVKYIVHYTLGISFNPRVSFALHNIAFFICIAIFVGYMLHNMMQSMTLPFIAYSGQKQPQAILPFCLLLCNSINSIIQKGPFINFCLGQPFRQHECCKDTTISDIPYKALLLKIFLWGRYSFQIAEVQTI